MAEAENSLPTISDAMSQYLRMVERARSKPTMLAYRNALLIFSEVLEKRALPPQVTPIANLTEEAFAKFVEHLSTYATATEQLYLQAVKGFYLFADAEGFMDVNQSRLTVLIRQRSRRPGTRVPQFPAEDIEALLDKVQDVSSLIVTTSEEEDAPNVKLRAYRDRAFLITLADTGFRVHEACNLRRGDIDWNEQRAIIIGKGNKQAVVRFTSRSLHAIQEYLAQRAALDGNSGKQLSSLPLFARHDKGAGKKVKPMTPTTGRNIVRERVLQFLGKEMAGRITPHSFRHYFVTSVLRGTGNLRYAQELARHKNIQVTQRYTHLSNDELDKAFYEVFEKQSKKK
ncbi:MAG TPA: tyrosine-type recombinase/integrase [Anaerolineales bacterium]|nr:tyrosine-type recombinase/integrase [Anaerolineales bacterium]HNO31220.1 tyrosine-type recombinase/integrase [Anaerolineales bacterium]